MSKPSQTTHAPGTHPDWDPPATSVGVLGWLRENLFSGWFNTLLTFLGLYLTYLIFVPLIDWAIIKADWVGDSRDACNSGGACWVFVTIRFEQFMYGLYPSSEYWRINLVALLLIATVAWLTVPRIPHKRYGIVFALLVFPVLTAYLVGGGVFGLVEVETSRWGGLTLTLMLAAVGIVAAFPLGVILALGRRSQMPIVRAFCVAYIELWRGVPLITVLFMSSVMLPLFLPEGVNFDKLLRALIGITLFQASYIAEVVRGGLQAIPKGQYEAADALGLSYWKKMTFVILPQALKMVIPGLVNTFNELFKDTTLVLIIGLMDLLAIIQAALEDPKWLGYSIEGYFFAAIIFWIFCFGMSRYSQAIERRLHTGHRR